MTKDLISIIPGILGYKLTSPEIQHLNKLIEKHPNWPTEDRDGWIELIEKARELAFLVTAGHVLTKMLSQLEPDELDHGSGQREFYLGPIFLSQQPPEFLTALAQAGWKYGDSVIQDGEAVTIIHSDCSPDDNAQEFLQALVQRWGEAVDGDEAMDSGDVIEWLGQAVHEARLILGVHPTKGT